MSSNLSKGLKYRWFMKLSQWPGTRRFCPMKCISFVFLIQQIWHRSEFSWLCWSSWIELSTPPKRKQIEHLGMFVSPFQLKPKALPKPQGKGKSKSKNWWRMKPSWDITLPFIFYIAFHTYFPASCHKERERCVGLSRNAQFVSPFSPLPENPSLIPRIPLGSFLAFPHCGTNRNFHWIQPIFQQDSGIPQARLAGQGEHIPDPWFPSLHWLFTLSAKDTLQFLEFSSWEGREFCSLHLIQIMCINNAYFAFLGGWFSLTHPLFMLF